MKVFGTLDEAGFELLSSDPTNEFPGRIYFNYVTGKIRVFNNINGEWHEILSTKESFPVPAVENNDYVIKSNGTGFILAALGNGNMPAFGEGDALKIIRVNETETSAEWAEMLPSYNGNAGRVLKVNETENGIEWGNGLPAFTGHAGKLIKVNNNEDEVEYTDTIAGKTFNSDNTGYGLVPVGTIIPIASNIAGSYSIPAGGTVDSNGWQYCNGNAIPANMTLSGNTPDLTDGRFLMGSTVSGTRATRTSITLGSANIPSHSHTIDHGHSNTFSLGGTTTFPNTSHTHNMAHAHQWGYMNGDVSNPTLHTLGSLNDSLTDITASDYAFATSHNNFANGTAANYALRGPGSPWDAYTTGAMSPPSGSHGSTAATGTSSANTGTVSLSGGVTSMTGSSGAWGQGSPSAIDITPTYHSVQYLMRVK